MARSKQKADEKIQDTESSGSTNRIFPRTEEMLCYMKERKTAVRKRVGEGFGLDISFVRENAFFI
jgi:hypothetical protein